MTVKEQVIALVNELPDDSELLHEFLETLELNRALAKGFDDLKNDRVYTVEEARVKLREHSREAQVSPRLKKALDESADDVRHGRMYTSEEFMAKVNERWPL